MDGVGAHRAGLGDEQLVRVVRTALDGMLAHGARAGLAVSGGADSVALAHLGARARPDVTWVVVHVRHGLRDDQSDADAARACAEAIGAAYDERAADVRRRPRRGLEADARTARYAAFRTSAQACGLDALCLAHTADDRAETLLLNLGRGAGIDGLGAMPPVRHSGRLRILRPLLRVRRADVRAAAARRGWRWVEDPTNRDPWLRRTRVRDDVLPALARLSGGPGDPVAVLCRLADLAAADAAALDALAAEAARAHVVAWGPVRAVRVEALAGLPVALARRVVRRMLVAVRGRAQGLSADDVEGVRALRPGGARTVAGGVLATSGQGWIAAAPTPPPPLPSHRLAAPGRVALDAIGLIVHADLATGPPPDAATPPRLPGPGPRPWAVLPQAGLAVRSLRDGDRFDAPSGDVSVARLLAEAGVPRPVRAVLPLVVDADDRVRWVPGVTGSLPEARGTRVWLAPAQATR